MTERTIGFCESCIRVRYLARPGICTQCAREAASVASVAAAAGRRPFAVVVAGRTVELHATEAAAQAGADRLNGVCALCGTAGRLHTASCPTSRFELDPDFGAEMEPDEDE